MPYVFENTSLNTSDLAPLKPSALEYRWLFKDDLAVLNIRFAESKSGGPLKACGVTWGEYPLADGQFDHEIFIRAFNNRADALIEQGVLVDVGQCAKGRSYWRVLENSHARAIKARLFINYEEQTLKYISIYAGQADEQPVGFQCFFD